MYCKLCGNIFRKDDASKILTYKLLWEFDRHLRKRGINLKGIEITNNSTRPCRVCELCYEVVVAEHKLIEKVQKFALSQNIQIKDLFVKVQDDLPAKNRPVFVSNVLKQWRLLMLFKEIKISSDMAKSFEYHKFDSKVFYLHVRIGNNKAVFPLRFRVSHSTDFFTLSINVLKIVYFFSEVKESIAPFLSRTDLHFRICDNALGNSEIASGVSKTLYNFDMNTFEGQKQENLVYLFFKNGEYMSLKIMLGLVSDGEYNTAHLNLYSFNDVLFPDDDFYNCNVFPNQWIEIFTEDAIAFSTKIEDQKHEEISQVQLIRQNLIKSGINLSKFPQSEFGYFSNKKDRSVKKHAKSSYGLGHSGKGVLAVNNENKDRRSRFSAVGAGKLDVVSNDLAAKKTLKLFANEHHLNDFQKPVRQLFEDLKKEERLYLNYVKEIRLNILADN